MRRRKPADRTRRRADRHLPFTDAPLFHALQLLATGDSARFHMPGHKGEPLFSTFADVFAIDFTETYGTGNLYLGDGPIREAEQAAARYFAAPECFFLTGGSTQGILSMLAAAVGEGGSVLLDRGCHKSVCHACALLNITPYFFSAPLLEPFGCAGALPLDEIDARLAAHPEIRAVLVTSPTYYGVRRDIAACAALVHARGGLLLVDGAHGTHFPALGLPAPVAEGADLAVLSIHKTLPAMGQAAVLLAAAGVDTTALREFTALFGTSSPSYPVMASIDLARAYTEGRGRDAYRRAAEGCGALRDFVAAHTPFIPLTETDYPVLDPCRLTVCTAGTDMTGHALADALWSEYGVACEMADDRNAVFILTGADNLSALRRLRRGLRRIADRRDPAPLPAPTGVFPAAERVLSVREAWFAPRGRVAPDAAEGQVCARPVTPYPPGVPLLWPGEKITRAHIELIRERWYNEIEEITVVLPPEREKGGNL